MRASDRRPALPHRRGTGRALVGVIVLVAVIGGSLGAAHAGSPTPQISGSVAAPSAADISPICDAPDPTGILGPSSSVPSDPTSTLVSPPGGVVNFTATSTDLYVDTGSQLVTYTLAGSEVRSFNLPSVIVDRQGNEVSQPVIDPSGNIYLASYYDQILDKFSPTGQLLWSVDPGNGNPTGIFSVGAGSNFELAVSVVQDSSGSDLINLSTGAVGGSFPLFDDFDDVTQESDGNLLVSGNGYVETLDPTGGVLSSFGSSRVEGAGVHTGSGAQFYYPAQAAQGPDGTIYTADPLNTIEATSPQGYLEGSTTLSPGDSTSYTLAMGGHNFYLVGSTFFYQGGPPFNSGADNISTVSLATLTAYLDAAHVPTDTLGWGAGLSSSAPANYFAPGTTPDVYASFDPWWLTDASHLQLSYSVEDTASLEAESVPSPTTVPLPTSAGGLADIPLAIPVADRRPGPYLVRASLFDTSTSPSTLLGTTCLPYTVGAAGDQLDLGSLPAGIGAGGPDDTRGVALNAQLGLDGYRGATIDWSTFLPHCSPSDPTAATCGPSAMTFAGATTDAFKAAYLAQLDHVTYWLQASGGSGGSVPTALVDNGWWKDDVTALVRYYSSVPAGCGQCAPVTMWEPWNEPNNTGWSTRRPVRHPGTRALLPGGEVGPARLGLDGHRRIVAQRLDRLVAAADRGRRSQRPRRGLHPPLYGQQRLVRGGRDPRPGPAAREHARRQAPVVHRGRVVEQRRLQLSEPGQRGGPGDDLAEGARCPGVELLLRRGELGQRRGLVLADPGVQHRRLCEASGAGHHGHLLRDRRPPLPLDAGNRHTPDLRGVLRRRLRWSRQGRRRVVRRAGHHRLGHRDRSWRRLDSGDGDL